MKIAVTGTRGIPHILGGVETHCEELFPRLAGKGFDITIIRRKSYVQDSLSEYKGVHLLDIPTPRKKAFEAIIHTLKAIHAAKFKLKADLVHIHAIGPALATPYAKLLGLKVVITHHGPDYDRAKWGKAAQWMLRLGERIGVLFADGVIVISETIHQIVKTRYGRTDAHLIHNGVSQPVFASDNDYLHSLGIEAQKYIFAMGRFVPEKNFHQLVRAFASLNEKKGYRLVLAGDADFEDEYSIALKQLAGENNVVLTGFVKGHKLQTLLSQAAAFVLPSSHEGLPISLLEAMSYHLPVLASDIPANLEVGLPPENYFPVNDTIVLAEKLNNALSIGKQDVFYNMEVYDWDKIAEQTAAVYNRCFCG
ncbi:MAG: glycosyltransferase family 4 protein [Candidatus Symbiothrix sp.]|jgi:glycosyltransferase involved in cell wall biosynthesis|nr:glycosyltransferase family 4 protein [Candidatus Symbiothrix sp.]